MKIPKFDYENESTLALKIGLVFFLLLACLLMLHTWILLNPRPRTIDAERIFEKIREQKGVDFPVPSADKPKPDHFMAIRSLVGAVGSVTLGVLPIVGELRRRSLESERNPDNPA